MRDVVGVFKSRSDAQAAAKKLGDLGIQNAKIRVLTPEVTSKELAAVPTMEAEQPGVVKALGAVVGGAVGFGAAEALSFFLVPGIGPIAVLGLAGGTLLGALGGGTAGAAFENTIFAGLPEDELFVYEDALRQGRTIVIVSPKDEIESEAVRGELEYAGAESIDRAREMWWLGVRDVEKEKYESNGGNFEEDERYFRAGFEAALHSKNRHKSYDEWRAETHEAHATTQEREAFRRGYHRGSAYQEALRMRQA